MDLPVNCEGKSTRNNQRLTDATTDQPGARATEPYFLICTH